MTGCADRRDQEQEVNFVPSLAWPLGAWQRPIADAGARGKAGLSPVAAAAGGCARRTAKIAAESPSATKPPYSAIMPNAFWYDNNATTKLPRAAAAICRKPISPDAVPASRGWMLSAAAMTAGPLMPSPISASPIGTNRSQTCGLHMAVPVLPLLPGANPGEI
jgi:hypothetical protein